MFRTVPLRPSSGVFHCTHSNGVCHTGLLTACEQDQDGAQLRPDPARKLYDIYHCCLQWKTPDDGQRNFPKHVEFYLKNKFGKLVHLVGFIIIFFLIFCWPCISIYLFLNINQLDALNFIISLFHASTCFEHMCSKHVEAWNKLIIKFSASSWLILRNKKLL